MAAVQVYHHENVEEIKMEQTSSEAKKSSFINNLSELDSLLQDLNNARYTRNFKEADPSTNGAVDGPRPSSVDSLLDELDSSVETSRRVVVEVRPPERRTTTTTSTTTTSTSVVDDVDVVDGVPSASNATRELDDLMASLSDFKVNDRATTTKRNNDGGDDGGVVLTGTAPARPPPPSERDVLAVPPPRPPAPAWAAHAHVGVPTPAWAAHEGAHHGGGGPVRRNDQEYRWVTDGTTCDAVVTTFHHHDDDDDEERRRGRGRPQRVVVVPSRKIEIINAHALQTQVDSAYAKPQKPGRSQSPAPAVASSAPSAAHPTPTPTRQGEDEEEAAPPTPTPPTNQLDSMLGSLASHMTEQGVTTTQKGCCCACDKPIVGQVITALGKTWHPEHFTCSHCNQELGTRNFFEREGRPYCEPDYHNLFSPRCAYCNGPILDKCVTALDKTWHPEHFFCAQCGNTFGDDGFHEKNGKPFCREDYFGMFAPKCGGCNSPIMENYISALNAQWHPECFVCRDCRQPFNGGSFFDHEGLPYCETHYHAKRGSLCAGCNKPITGRCITAMFRKFHPEHFVCSFCLKQLNKGTFKEQNDKPYCHGCFDKLFG